MVDFPSNVAVPSTGAYGPPQVDFNWLANLANDYYKGKQNQFNDQQNQQTIALQQAFKGGLPTNPDGTINYQAVVQSLAQKGDINAITQIGPLAQQQQQIKQAQQLDPLLGGGAPQAQPQSQSQQPVGDLPPASAGLARPTTGGQPSPQGGATVAAIVSSVVPNGEIAGTVSVNVARALRVDPSTPLNDEQQARAVSLVRSYAQRRPQPTAQPGSQPDDGLARLQNATFGQESSYGRNDQTSSAGAQGPMQIEPGTFKQFAAAGENIGNTTDNKDVGNRILASYWKRYNGDAARAAVAYYSGPGNVAPPDSPTPWKRDISRDKNGKPILPVSQYVDQVMNRMGVGALREATAQPPMAPGQRVAQGFGAPPQVQPIAPGQAPVQPGVAGGPIAAQGQTPPPVAAQGPAALPPQATPTQFAVPGNAQPQPTAQPAAAQQGPIGPRVALAHGFGPGQEPQAILALREHAMELASSPNPLLQKRAPFFENWAGDIEKSIQPFPVRPGETLLDPRDRSVIYQGSPTNPNALALQRFLAENPGASAQQIDQFLQAGRSSGRSAIAMYMNKYLQEHPEANADEVKRAAQLFTTQTTAQNRFLSGPQGNTIRSLNVVVSHLQTMQDLGDALKNGNTRIFNSIAQRFAEETGSPAPTNFDTAKQIVGAEVIKALGVAGAGSQSERQEAADAFNRARSPQQLAGAIAAARKLLVGQLEGLRQQYKASTGLSGESFDEMLQPETRQYFGQGTGETKAPPKPDKDGWVTYPNGTRIREVQ